MRLLRDSVVVTSVWNEGPFLLEWLAWYRMLGFESFLVVHNDCTDHSPQMLRVLEKADILVQKKNEVDPNRPPQPQNHAVATNHRLVKNAKWLWSSDIDEYLVIHVGDGSAAALAEEIDGKGYGMAINWRIFGSSGHEHWEDTFIRHRFRKSALEGSRSGKCYKTFYKNPVEFGRIRSHGPRGWRGDKPWGEEDRVFLLADGSRFPDYHPVENKINGTPHDRVTNKMAQVNHYALQSHEQFEYKRGRLGAAAHLDRYTDQFFKDFDKNRMRNTSALRHEDAFRKHYDQLVAIPGILRLHHLCCADFLKFMADKQGDDVRNDSRYRYHLRMAARLPHHDPEEEARRNVWWRKLWRALRRPT
ncbi:MAG TPA: hypothetical protein DEO85_03280 [Maritimibacter sp.]|nr:hypothetical protein [Maritimibacter sp.]